MHAALSYLGTLPEETIVYNGHEYTGGNVAFGKSVDPTNPGITRLANLTQENKITAGLSTIGDEKEWNIFMRLDSEAVKYGVVLYSGQRLYTGANLRFSLFRKATGATGESAIMDKLREMKNSFRG